MKEGSPETAALFFIGLKSIIFTRKYIIYNINLIYILYVINSHKYLTNSHNQSKIITGVNVNINRNERYDRNTNERNENL